MNNIIEYYSRVDKLYTKTMSDVCKKHDLTFMELTVLLFLANNPSYDTATDIVQYRHLTKSHVSVSVRSLTEKGLLSSEHRDNNHRTVHLLLSDKTDAIIKDGRSAQKAYIDSLTEGFSDKEKKDLTFLLNKIDNNIKNNLNSKENSKNDKH